MQDTCVYQAPVEVGELKKKKKNAILHFRNVLFFIITTVFVALKKNTFTYKETFIVSYQTKH